MSVVAIELTDAGLLVVGEAQTVGAGSPGYALLDGERLLTGRDALSQARLRPRFVHSRFWRDLGTEPLGRPFPAQLTTADLAHAHLQAVWKAAGIGIESAILVVPGCYTEHQLGLAVGIARACGIPVRGLVDGAVAAAEGQSASRMLHLDLQLHQAVLTELQQNGERSRGAIEASAGAGLIPLQDLWARRAAAIFVRRTRFDPLHGAASEQALYERLAGWLDALRRSGETVAALPSGTREHTVELTRSDMVAAAEPIYRGVADLVRRHRRPGEAVTLLLTHRAAELPGLPDLMADLPDTRVVALSAAAAGAGALLKRWAIEAPGEALPFVTRLPGDRTVPPAAVSPPVPPPATPPRQDRDAPPLIVGPRERPTHLVANGRGYRIGQRPLVLGSAPAGDCRGVALCGNVAGMSRSHCSVVLRHGRPVVDDHSTHGTFLNDEPVRGAAELHAGDRLRLGTPGIEVLLVVVDAGGG